MSVWADKWWYGGSIKFVIMWSKLSNALTSWKLRSSCFQECKWDLVYGIQLILEKILHLIEYVYHWKVVQWNIRSKEFAS